MTVRNRAQEYDLYVSPGSAFRVRKPHSSWWPADPGELLDTLLHALKPDPLTCAPGLPLGLGSHSVEVKLNSLVTWGTLQSLCCFHICKTGSESTVSWGVREGNGSCQRACSHASYHIALSKCLTFCPLLLYLPRATGTSCGEEACSVHHWLPVAP